MHITLRILTRNERPCVEIVFPKIPPADAAAGFDDVVVIDGGSSDGTREYFEQRGSRVLGESRRERGHAFQLAFATIQTDAFIFFARWKRGSDRITKIPPSTGERLRRCHRLAYDGGSAQQGRRAIAEGTEVAIKAFNLAANLFFRKVGPYITDSINGYHAITRAAAHELQLDADDFTIEYQMTMRAPKRSS